MKSLWYPIKKLNESLEELQSQAEYYSSFSENSKERIEWELAYSDTLISIALINTFKTRKEQRVKDFVKSKSNKL